MAERTQTIRHWRRAALILANAAVAEKGNLACLNATGRVVPGQVALNLRPIGYFDENMTGNGVQTVGITLFKEVVLHRMVNSGTDAVTAANVGSIVFIQDGQTISRTNGTDTRSPAGRLWAVNGTTVMVEMGAV